MPKEKFVDYLKSTIGMAYTPELPTKEKLQAALDKGEDLNAYFYDSYNYESRQNFGSTLLFALIKKFNGFQGKKRDKALELIGWVLDKGADPNIGFVQLNAKMKPQGGALRRPLEEAISQRIPPVIKLLVDHGSIVLASDKEVWVSYLLQARTPNELEKLRTTMHILDPMYKDGNESPKPEARPVPYNAVNSISYADIEDGDILVNINREYFGEPGVLGEHSHFYKQSTWDAWEKQFLKTQELMYQEYAIPRKTLKSPYTQKPITSKVLYRAEKMAAPNGSEATGGKRRSKTMKKRKPHNK